MYEAVLEVQHRGACSGGSGGLTTTTIGVRGGEGGEKRGGAREEVGEMVRKWRWDGDGVRVSG